MTKLLAHVAAAILVAWFAAVAAFIVVIWIQMGIHGAQAFDHDAGADFALAMLATPFAVLAGILSFLVAFDLIHFRQPAEPVYSSWSWACWRKSKSPPGES